MVFRIHVNECRRSDEDPPQPRASFNGPLGRFLDQGYISTQVLSIRRLVEREARDDDRQPISIRRVLRDIRQHRHLFTREIYVAYDGLPYDYAAKRQEWFDANATDIRSGAVVRSMDTKGPEAWTSSELVHENFDRMSGVSAEDRDRADLISNNVFDQISNVVALQEIRDVAFFADKFVAHAADPLSRAEVTDEEMAISMSKLATCHAALISATKMICEQLLWDASTTPIPTPQFDAFEHLDTPWVPTPSIEGLQRLWHDRERELSSWQVPRL